MPNPWDVNYAPPIKNYMVTEDWQGTEEPYVENPVELPWEVNYIPTPDPAPEAPAGPTQAEQVEDNLEGMTLRPFGIDTGVEVPNAVMSTLVGAGREMDKLGSGTMDIFDRIVKRLSPVDSVVDKANKRIEDRQAEQATLDEGYASLAEERPVTTVAGGVLPYLATAPLGLASGTARGATHIAAKTGAKETLKNIAKLAGRESAIGAGTGAAHYDDTAASGALWGAGGALAGKALGNVLGGNANKLNAEEQRVIDFARKNKLYTPSGMSTGNTRLQQMDQALKTHPTTANKVDDRLRASQQIENNIISKELGGEKADFLSVDYLEDQRNRITGKMDDLVEGTTGKVTDDTALKATNIIENFKVTDPDQKSRAILDSFERRLYDMADSGKDLTGKEYQTLTSKLNKAANKQFSTPMGDRDLGHALSKISTLFDDSIQTGLNTTNISDWKKARKQYALLNAIEDSKVMSNRKGESGVSGFVDTLKLSKKFGSSDKINKLGEVQRLRNAQPGSSLGTSGLLARSLNPLMPMEAAGAGLLLSGRLTDKLPILPDMITGLYMSGYPHATGMAPIFGREYTQPAIEALVPRGLMVHENDEE